MDGFAEGGAYCDGHAGPNGELSVEKGRGGRDHRAYRDEAEALLDAPGDVAVVIRGRQRSLVMRCPDGCGETLVINLDERAGKAWRIDTRHGLTLYPSVWRESRCESHFIIWRDHILWCGRYARPKAGRLLCTKSADQSQINDRQLLGSAESSANGREGAQS